MFMVRVHVTRVWCIPLEEEDLNHLRSHGRARAFLQHQAANAEEKNSFPVRTLPAFGVGSHAGASPPCRDRNHGDLDAAAGLQEQPIRD